MLREGQDIIFLAEHPSEVYVGLWFHHVIYDTQRHDNKERSADWARSAARDLGASAESAQRIYDLVMFTRHVAEPVAIDAQVLVDTDLSILGALLRGSRSMRHRFGASMGGFLTQCSGPLEPRY